MGVARMKLFLVQADDRSRRQFCKGVLEANRVRKDIGKATSTVKEFEVILTKDGVIEALNRSPFRTRVREATAAPEPQAIKPLPEMLRPVDPLTIPDDDDRERLARCPPEYVRGWNQVKRRAGSARKA